MHFKKGGNKKVSIFYQLNKNVTGNFDNNLTKERNNFIKESLATLAG